MNGPVTRNGKHIQENVAAAPKTAVRATPKPETIVASSTSGKLERRISEFHPDHEFTRCCFGEMQFSDRSLNNREKYILLAICERYEPTRRKQVIAGYLGYLKYKRSDEVDLDSMLLNFHPTNVMDVNKYATAEMGRLLRKIRRINNND